MKRERYHPSRFANPFKVDQSMWTKETVIQMAKYPKNTRQWPVEVKPGTLRSKRLRTALKSKSVSMVHWILRTHALPADLYGCVEDSGGSTSLAIMLEQKLCPVEDYEDSHDACHACGKELCSIHIVALS